MEAKSSMFTRKDELKKAKNDKVKSVVMVTKVKMPTKYGIFDLYGFHEQESDLLHTALVKGDVKDSAECAVRIHSECYTGDVLGSMRCDCGEQLEESMDYISKQPCGVLIYLRQEGRGIGLLNKLKAYSLQDNGLDTVQANEFLGFSADSRDYFAGAEIIRYLGIKSIVLLTNNPDKIEKLTEEGIEIVRRQPLYISPNMHNRHYMETKKIKMGHLY